jgi:hypothetical protein
MIQQLKEEVYRLFKNSASVAYLSGKKKWIILKSTKLIESLLFPNAVIVHGDVFSAQALTVLKQS